MIRTLEEYIRSAAALEAASNQAIDQMASNPEMASHFLCYRANRQRFLPDYPHDDLHFFKKTQFNIKFSAHVEIKTDLPVLFDQMELAGDLDFLQHAGKQPYIFCTFHFGPFRLIGPLLAKYGFHLSVLTLKEGITYDLLHQSANEELEVLHADSTSVMLEMMNNLKSGKSVKAFIDGNAGLVKDPDLKSFAKVDFLNTEFYCKKGMPLLSYLTGVPIIPIISYRETLTKTKIIFDSPIYPSRQVPKEEFVQTTIQRHYDLLDKHLRRMPEQWVYWKVVNEFVDLPWLQAAPPAAAPAATPADQYAFNGSRYDLYRDEKINYLFDKYSYQSFPLSLNLSGYLAALSLRSQATRVVTAQLNQGLLQDLLSRQVLVGT